MWSLIWKWAVAKVLFRSFGWLALLIPVALALKAFGLPLLAILGGLSVPVLIVLAFIGLPIIAVLVVGGILMSVLAAVVVAGLAVAKIVVPILLLWWAFSWLFGCGRGTHCGKRPGEGEVGPDAA